MGIHKVVARLQETAGLLSSKDKALIIQFHEWVEELRKPIGSTVERLLRKELPIYAIPIADHDFFDNPNSRDYRRSTYTYIVESAVGMEKVSKMLGKFPNPPKDLDLKALAAAMQRYAKISRDCAEKVYARAEVMVKNANTMLTFVPWKEYVKLDSASTKFDSVENIITGYVGGDTKNRFILQIQRYKKPGEMYAEAGAPWGLQAHLSIKGSPSVSEFFDLEKGVSKDDFQTRFMAMFTKNKAAARDRRQKMQLLKQADRKLTLGEISLLSAILSISNMGMTSKPIRLKGDSVYVDTQGRESDYDVSSEQETQRSGSYLWNTFLSYVGGDASEDDLDAERDDWTKTLRNKSLLYVGKTWEDLFDLCFYLSQRT